MDNLRENFRNWLTKQGLSEKTETGRPSTIFLVCKLGVFIATDFTVFHSNY